MESSPRHIRPVSGTGDQPGDAGGPTSPSPDPAHLLSAMREAAEHESAKEERLEGKTRATVAVAGAYFAIVQTATFSASGTLGRLEGAALNWTVGLAIAAIVTLGIAIFAAVKQQWPREHRSLPSPKIGQEILDLVDGKLDEREALRTLIGRYARVTKTRQKANDQRVKQYAEAGVFSLLAVIATTTELIVSLVTRL
jgi:hypothetical protein